MKLKTLFTAFIILQTLSGWSQTETTLKDSELSYNDRGIEFIDSQSTWEAIRSFERAIRSGGSQRRAAIDNVSQFRKDTDLPAHTLLHFGWLYGIGRLAGALFPNIWYIVSILSLVGLIGLSISSSRWSWKVFALCISIATISLFLAYCHSAYVESEDLVVFVSDTDLKDKPYDFSGQKQIVYEGQMARIEQTYEEYYQVQTDTYETGWILKDRVVPIW